MLSSQPPSVPRSSGTISFFIAPITGLVFAKLFFPHSDPWVGTLEAFAIYAVGFVARPIGAAIFGHYGDRIGRKSTLIATLLPIGLATSAVALVPTYASIGIWGRRGSDDSAFRAGSWRRRGVGRFGPFVHGMGSHRPLARLHRLMAAIRRAVRLVPGQSGGSGIQPDVWRSVPCLGLACAVSLKSGAGRRRALHPPRRSRNAGVQQASRRAQDRADADSRSHQASSEGDRALRLRTDG